MTLDIQSGDLVIGAERIGATLSEAKFLEMALGKSSGKIRSVPLGNWYQVWLPQVRGRDLGITLFFSQNGLEQARMKFVRADVRAAGHWSKEIEDEMKLFHDSWLSEQSGAPIQDFPWGSVRSVIDEHGYSAVVVVHYEPVSGR